VVGGNGYSNIGNASSVVTLGDGIYKGTLSYTGGTASFIRGFTVSAGGGEVDNTTGTLTIGTAGIAAGGAFTVGGAGNTSVTSAISSTGSLTKTGAGTLTLSGTNTYTGTTTISQGTISANKIVVSGNNSSLGNASSPVVLGDATHSGTLSSTQGSSPTYTRGFTVNAGGGEIDNTTGILSIDSDGITVNGTLTLGRNAGITISSIIADGITAGSLSKIGTTSTLTLSNTNTFTGGLTIKAGTVQGPVPRRQARLGETSERPGCEVEYPVHQRHEMGGRCDGPSGHVRRRGPGTGRLYRPTPRPSDRY